MRVLVSGATGYVGGRLVPVLLDAGHEVVCLARTPAKLDDRPWRDRVEVIRGDATDRGQVAAAMADCEVAHYLLHSMDGEGDFVAREQAMARTFRLAAQDAGVGRIVYLGGLVAAADELSEHMASRVGVGRELADGTVDVTELRAAVIIGSGSASFEMLRNLVEVLPVMVTPKWADNRCQPIAIRDVLALLVAVLDDEPGTSRIVEIGGPDVLTYRQLMAAYAEAAGLPKRLMVPVPVLTPWLSSHWVGLVTPLPVGLAKPLVQSLSHESIVTDPSGMATLPAVEVDVQTAIRLALARIHDLEVTTSWSGAGGVDSVATPLPEDPDWSGGSLLSDRREVTTEHAVASVWQVVEGIGGGRGWYSADALWHIRGLVDQAVGGSGLRRGRRDPNRLHTGDALDFWRVQDIERPTSGSPGLLRLRAEMRLPGEAWLEFRVEDVAGVTTLVQEARYHPHGFLGRAYWWALWPFHQVIFPRMARRIVEAAGQIVEGGPSQR